MAYIAGHELRSIARANVLRSSVRNDEIGEAVEHRSRPLSRQKRTCPAARPTAALVESPGGISPPGAPRTVHDPLESHGSRCSAVAMAELPVSEEVRARLAGTRKPFPNSLRLVSHALELATRPANDIGIDPDQGRTQ